MPLKDKVENKLPNAKDIYVSISLVDSRRPRETSTIIMHGWAEDLFPPDNKLRQRGAAVFIKKYNCLNNVGTCINIHADAYDESSGCGGKLYAINQKDKLESRWILNAEGFESVQDMVGIIFGHGATASFIKDLGTHLSPPPDRFAPIGFPDQKHEN